MANMFVSAIVFFFGGGGWGWGVGDKAVPPWFCVSLLSKVITDAVNSEWLTNLCPTIYTMIVFVTKNSCVDQVLNSCLGRTLHFACCFQGVTLGAGLIITFLSFVIVYFINKKADLIFTPTDPPSSSLDS